MRNNIKTIRVRDLPLDKRMQLYNKAMIFRKRFGWGYRKVAKILNISSKTSRAWINEGRRPNTNYNKFNNQPSAELAYIIGVKLGDGSFHKHERSIGIRLKVKDKDFAEAFAKCVAKVLNKQKSYKIYSYNGFYIVEALSLLLYNFLRSESNRLMIIEHFPEHFIRGLADSDGSPLISICKIRDRYNLDIRVEITNQNYDLLKYVKKLLKVYFGINSNIRLGKKSGATSIIRGQKVVTKKDTYSLRINNFEDIKKFAKLIGFSIKRKQEKLETAITIKERYGREITVRIWKSLYQKVKGKWIKTSIPSIRL